ncbi:MAG: hypothetical protein KatS3mg002_1592 [Candidatus Woesearchaeota archaeon]|nr:MAG: hypothetical protein KatS3mg002_1592 [Candidatus Woesearchaeota archaeon]
MDNEFVKNIPIVVICKIEKTYFTNLFFSKLVPYELLDVVSRIYRNDRVRWYELKINEDDILYKNNSLYFKYFIISMFDVFMIRDDSMKFRELHGFNETNAIEVSNTIISSLFVPLNNPDSIFANNLILIKAEKEGDKLKLYTNIGSGLFLIDIFKYLANHTNETKCYQNLLYV